MKEQSISIDKHLESIQIIELLIGARGTIPTFFLKVCKDFGLTNDFIHQITITTLKRSVIVFRNHEFRT